ncbi:MAG: MipA/OmpV family protein [Smithella sp.]
MHIRYRVIVALLILSFLLPGSAICEEKPLWELGVGLGLLQIPDYLGSDENRLYPLPYPSVVYRGDILKIDEQRVSGQIFKTDRISLLTVGLGKEYNQFVLNAFDSADFLQGATFENSPLVKRETSFMSGISVAWIFFKSAKTVNVEKYN